MVIEGVLCLFSDCECCRFVSISRIRLLKMMTTEAIKINAARMIRRSQAYFLICIVTITNGLVTEVNFRPDPFTNLKLDKYTLILDNLEILAGQRPDRKSQTILLQEVMK